MSSVVISGDISGSVTLDAPSVAGTTVLTLPATSGTVLTQNPSAPANSLVVDASGNVGIGTTSPAAKLEVSFADAISGGVRISNTSTGISFARLINSATSPNDNNWNIECGRDGTRNFAIRDNLVGERMRIDSSGNVLINTTSVVNNSRLSVVEDLTSLNGIGIKNTGTTYGGSTDFIVFMNNVDAAAGRVSQTAVTTVAYTTSSDYRLKENIVPMTGALNKVLQLKPVSYRWKQDGSNGQGFIAHELQEIVPDCVVGEKNAVDEEGKPVYQGIDTSFLVATLTAAIQEQQTIINDLKARVEALENK